MVTPKQEVERKSEWFCGVNFLFNSRTAIAGAIIGLLLVFFTTRRGVLVFSRFFYNSKNLNCIGALSFFFFKICSHIFMIFEVKLEW